MNPIKTYIEAVKKALLDNYAGLGLIDVASGGPLTILDCQNLSLILGVYQVIPGRSDAFPEATIEFRLRMIWQSDRTTHYDKYDAWDIMISLSAWLMYSNIAGTRWIPEDVRIQEEPQIFANDFVIDLIWSNTIRIDSQIVYEGHTIGPVLPPDAGVFGEIIVEIEEAYVE